MFPYSIVKFFTFFSLPTIRDLIRNLQTLMRFSSDQRNDLGVQDTLDHVKETNTYPVIWGSRSSKLILVVSMQGEKEQSYSIKGF